MSSFHCSCAAFSSISTIDTFIKFLVLWLFLGVEGGWGEILFMVGGLLIPPHQLQETVSLKICDKGAFHKTSTVHQQESSFKRLCKWTNGFWVLHLRHKMGHLHVHCFSVKWASFLVQNCLEVSRVFSSFCSGNFDLLVGLVIFAANW